MHVDFRPAAANGTEAFPPETQFHLLRQAVEPLPFKRVMIFHHADPVARCSIKRRIFHAIAAFAVCVEEGEWVHCSS
jgi:hypothetical protein